MRSSFHTKDSSLSSAEIASAPDQYPVLEWHTLCFQKNVKHTQRSYNAKFQFKIETNLNKFARWIQEVKKNKDFRLMNFNLSSF